MQDMERDEAKLRHIAATYVLAVRWWLQVVKQRRLQPTSMQGS
jgi:hypothetical protein